MRLKWIMAGVVATLLAAASGSVAANAGTTGAPQRAAPYCGITWGSQEKSGGNLSTGALLEVRTGRHECFDRVVFEFNGPANGFNVGYRDVFTEAVGDLMNPYVAGGAVLGVQLMAPAYSPDYSWVFPARSGAHVGVVVGNQTLRDVMFGGSYEGYSTFAVGVRATLPFRVIVLAGPGSHSRIVIDIAHRWQ
jgi:hypothetical protein